MKKCSNCYGEVADVEEKCPMCGSSEFEEDKEDVEISEQAEHAIKTVFKIGNSISLIIAIVVCGSFIGAGVQMFNAMGGFNEGFKIELLFPIVFIGFGIFALVASIKGYTNNKHQVDGEE